ncbi:MAG: IclR family transcriptional regulator [Rhodospirillaceae bacterium]|nr:MAG: IclR family transcriptional regulator [Rhodospirillaceae bacterium]
MIESVELALRILELLIHSEQKKGVSELAREIDLPKARTHRHLVTLMNLGYVEQDPETEKYAASPKIYMLGQALADRVDSLAVVRKMLGALRDELGMSVALSVSVPKGIRVVENFRGNSIIDVSAKSGAELPFHATAQGKVALAFGPKELLERCFESPLQVFTPQTIVAPDQLRSELSLVRRRGWAVAPEEFEPAFNALAAPIFGPGGKLLYTFALLDTLHGIPAEPKEIQLRLLTEASVEISRKLGWNKSTSIIHGSPPGR